MKTTKKTYGIALALTCSLATALKAQDLYVVNSGNGNGTIGEYGLDGSTVNASLVSGLDYPYAIAISGNDLFVLNLDNETIGEYTTFGATVNASLISLLARADAIAISGNDLFVANQDDGTIGEYTTSGATVNASLISGLNYPTSIAILGNDLFVANLGNGTGNGTIGEYTTSGATVNASLISGLYYPRSIAISGNDLFVVGDYKISEYTTSGATVNASLISGLGSPLAIAISGSDLFVASLGTEVGDGTIGEYTTSGAIVNASLISGLSLPNGIAVSPVPVNGPTANNQSVSTYEQTPVSITLSGTIANGDPLTYSVVSSPTQGTLTGTPPNETYTPNAEFSGSDSFTFQATDGSVNSNPATVSITVKPLVYGMDVSYSGSDATTIPFWREATNAGYKFAIVEGWSGTVLDVNQYASNQLRSARAVGMQVAGYCLLDFTTPQDGACQVRDAVLACGDQAQYLGFLAVDVEDDPAYDKSPVSQSTVLTYVTQAVNEVQRIGLTPVIYSYTYAWNLLMPANTTAFANFPLWLARHDQNPHLPAVRPPAVLFGTWSQALGEQYTNGITFSDFTSKFDKDIFDPTVFVASNPNFVMPQPQMDVSLGDGSLNICWAGKGLILQQCSSASGPWVNSDNQDSPVQITINPGVQFFRLQQSQ